MKSFWLPSSSPYFASTAYEYASIATPRVPPEFRFLYWDPEPLLPDGISCPHCASRLTNNGVISSGPIKIHDFDQPFFVIGCEYICRSNVCRRGASDGRRYASTDLGILRALPAPLRNDFPAQLSPAPANLQNLHEWWNWEARGVSKPLWSMLRMASPTGIPFESILQLLRASANGTYEDDGFPQEQQVKVETPTPSIPPAQSRPPSVTVPTVSVQTFGLS